MTFDPQEFPTYPAGDFFAMMDAETAPKVGVAVPPKRPPKSYQEAGGCDNYFTSLAGTMRARGFGYEAILAALNAENDALEDPMGAGRVQKIAASIAKKPAGVSAKRYRLTDAGNAERFADMAEGLLKFCPQRSRWYYWNGAVWSEDLAGTRAMAHAIKVARAIGASAEDEQEEDARKGLRVWANKSEDAKRLNAMISVAKAFDNVRISLADFDADPWLLNVANGILDLRNGQLVPHNPANLCAKITKAPFVPGARSETFDKYLAWATDNREDMAGFLQRAFGYSLTGDTSGQCLFMVIGEGGSGKTTLIELLNDLLGDYADTVMPETLLEKRNDGGVRNDLAALMGQRLVGVSEIKKDKTLDAGVVKSLSGSDSISARFLYGEPFTFKPIAKLWLAANTAPRVDVQDSGMWRRIIRIPFNNVVPEAKRNADLPAQLAHPDCLAAVLAWAVQGCLDWQSRGKGKAGLAEPDCIRTETAAYREALNPLNNFVTDCCRVGAGLVCQDSDLRAAYGQFCRRAAVKPVGAVPFKSLIERFGAKYATESGEGHTQRRMWSGITLTEPVTQHVERM